MKGMPTSGLRCGRLQEISAEELPVIPILYYVNVNIHNKKSQAILELFDVRSASQKLYEPSDSIKWDTVKYIGKN